MLDGGGGVADGGGVEGDQIIDTEGTNTVGQGSSTMTGAGGVRKAIP